MHTATSAYLAEFPRSAFVPSKGGTLPLRVQNPCQCKRTRCTTAPKKRLRYQVRCLDPSPQRNQEDDDDEDDPEVSRRVFLAGILATSIVTAAGAYRFVIGEDLESRIRLRIAQRFPSLFPREQTAEERRRPLNEAFAQAYVDSIQQVASEMQIIKPAQLHVQEEAVQQQAYPLFFADTIAVRKLSDPSWLNFVLYSRLHVISRLTSPTSRHDFVDKLARRTMSRLSTKPLVQTAEQARVNPDAWINRIRALLDELVTLGWISGYHIDDFDGGPGSLWQDERRSSMTLYAFDPVTMQAAQLIGEEEYEEISPKISGWIKAFLKDGSIKASLEDYYLDDAYRPDPEQFKPSQFATQLDLSL